MAKKKIKDDTKVESVSTNEAQLNLVRKAISKKYGEVVSKLVDHEDMSIPTISTGSISMDLALGNGGMAKGRIYEIFGPPGSGKSTLAVNVVIQSQRLGQGTLYIDAEHAVDPVLFKKYGVNTSALEVVQGFDGEQNLDILERFIKTGMYSVAVVDSVSALIPRAEAEADIDKDSMALQARLMSKALRKLTPIANQTGTLLIFINQLRKKIGSYGNPDTTTGGEALPFYSTGRISVRGPESKQRRLVDAITGEVYGHKAEFEITKNKLAAPFKKANINLIYGQGYDEHTEIMDLAVSLGIVDKLGAWYKYDGESFAQGEEKATAFIRDAANDTFYKTIRESVIDMLDLREVYESHSQHGPIYS